METYWYISDDKLKFSSEDASRWRDRFEGKVQLGVPAAGVGLEIGVRPPPDPTVIDDLRRFEQTVKRSSMAVDLTAAATGKPPALFSFQGFGARFLESNAFWVAGANQMNGFLLVGSIANAVGAGDELPRGLLSPSADPLGSVERLASSAKEGDQNDKTLSYVWAAIVSRAIKYGAVEDLPSVRGIAQYAGRQRTAPSETMTSGYASGVEVIVVGSPFFVALTGRDGK